MKNILTVLLLMFIIQQGFGQNLLEVDINSNGIMRKFYVQLPVADVDDLDTNLPLLIGFHGDGGTGNGFANYSGVRALATSKNFIGVFPNAVSGGWNRAVLGNSPANDLQFVDDMIDYMCTHYQINRNRVGVFGHSAGGFFSYRLAVERANKIAAISSVAGNLYGDASTGGDTYLTSYLSGSSFIKIPILQIHGDADGTVAYPDPNHQPDAWSEYPLTGFAYQTCGATTYTASAVTSINNDVKKIPYCSNSATSKEISLIRIIAGGHEWPAVKFPNVATYIVDYLLSHSLQGLTSCAMTNSLEVEQIDGAVYPNPVKDFVYFKDGASSMSLTVYGLTGETVIQMKNVVEKINLQDLQPGFYIVELSDGVFRQQQRIIKE